MFIWVFFETGIFMKLLHDPSEYFASLEKNKHLTRQEPSSLVIPEMKTIMPFSGQHQPVLPVRRAQVRHR